MQNEVATDFNNINYVVTNPKQEWYDHLERQESWDPNNSSIILQKRDGSWLKGTYLEYFKKKIQKILK